MVRLVGPHISGIKLDGVGSPAAHPVGTRVMDDEGNEYIYLLGVASTVVGSWVTYDELGVTALLAADAKGPVAVAMGIAEANLYGWYGIFGKIEAMMYEIAAEGTDALIGRVNADGVAGSLRAAGDEIYGAISRDANASPAALGTVHLYYPHVDDDKGS